MGLFGNYNKAGVGIAKNAPVKRPFFRFWEIFGSKFWKLIEINFVYLLFCIPIVTFGPATAALTQVMRKFTLGKPIFMFTEFWDAFKKNFRASFVIGIVDVIFGAAFAFLIFSYGNAAAAAKPDMSTTVVMAIGVAAALFFLMMNFYIYLQIVALTLKMPAILKNSMILAIAGLKSNVITLLSFAFFITLIVLFFPFSLFVLPVAPFAWMALICVFCSYPVIQKHIINPFYEAKGERNPELPSEDDDEDTIFTDMGGKEAPSRSAPEVSKKKRAAQQSVSKDERTTIKTKGKVIK